MVGSPPVETQYVALLVTSPVSDPDVWVDASTSWGVGLVIGGRWAACRLVDGWKHHDRDIGWAEAVALELAVKWLCSAGFSDAEIIIHGDNTGVMGAFDKGRSRNVSRNDTIRRIASYVIPANILIKPIYVASEMNIADPISCGILGLQSLRLECNFELPPELQPFLSHV
jgi:hypothetical protein